MNHFLKPFGSLLFILFSLSLTSRANNHVCGELGRGIVQSELVELDEEGHELRAGLEKLLTLFQNNRACQPTQFELVEETATSTKKFSSRRAVFKISGIAEADCGSRIFTAQEAEVPIGYTPRVLQVIDHTTRTCEDYKPYMWEVSLQSHAKKMNPIRNLFGNLRPFSAIQSE